MKRKSQSEPVAPPAVDPVVAVVPSSVKIYTVEERPVVLVPCVVCGTETDSEAEEKLCWVCRRLKISAWRDSELVPAQE